MPNAPSLASLLIQQTQATIYNAALSIATAIGLPVTSWQPGDPTRSLFYLEAFILEGLENVVVGFIQSGFLDYASQPNPDGSTNPWLAILAKQQFNVDVPGATYATTSVTLTNTGGGQYDIDPGDLTFKNSTTGATYHNTTAVTLTGVGTPNASGSVTVVADTAGVAGGSAANEIDTIVTGLLGVNCVNPAAAVGIDAQAPATTVLQCRDKLASLSPNGPAAAYSYVARNSALTGILSVTRARAYPNSDTGQVTLYVAGQSGAIGSGDVAAVQAALVIWCAPLCITPTTISANPVTIAVTYSLWLYQSVNQTQAQVEAIVMAALTAFFAARPIGGDIIYPAATGFIYTSMIEAAIGAVYPGKTFRLVLSVPALTGDTAMANGDVAAIGAVSPSVTFVPDPAS